jgi:hypothetical protein
MITEKLGLKSSRTAKEHYEKYLSRNSDRAFTTDEDEMIMRKVVEIGPKWSQIAKSFKDKSDVNVRNRFKQLHRKGDFGMFQLQEACSYRNQNNLNILSNRSLATTKSIWNHAESLILCPPLFIKHFLFLSFFHLQFAVWRLVFDFGSILLSERIEFDPRN